MRLKPRPTHAYNWLLTVSFLLVLPPFLITAHAQSLETKKHVYPKIDSIIPAPRFTVEHFAVPALLITYGFIALKSDELQGLDLSTQAEILEDHHNHHTKVDNYLQFAPALAVYGLNIAGIHGEHNLIDCSGLFLMSNIFLNVTVSSLKYSTRQKRPDGSDDLSFPSGHTAEAFASAEFLRLEYRNQSPLYGIAGYVVAAATGYLRMYNDKHFFSDVLAGAGIGILSTDLSYFLYPKIKRIFVRHKMDNVMVLPFYQNAGGGLALVYHIR